MTVASAQRTRTGATASRPAEGSSSTALLRQGSRGADVRALQAGLQALGMPVAIDGIFGPQTARAVRSFQQAQGLAVDALAGPQTLGRLSELMRQLPTDGMDTGARQGPTPRAPREAAPAQPTPAGRLRRGLAADAGGDAGAPPNQSARFERVQHAGQRHQMVEGRITINGNTYDFRSGGGGRGNLPAGDYQVTRHMDRRSDPTMNVGGEGYSFALSDKYDPRVDAKRTLLRIHPDGAGPGTIGCIGIVGDADTQRRFRQDMLSELARNGGSFTLSIR